MIALSEKRLILFAGHYGSGKTNIALNYARALKSSPGGEAQVTVADLDIVNPYFRTKDSASELAADGIDLVVSEYANSNVDFPALPKEIYALVGDASRDHRVVMDIGGDDRGALALGRYVDDIRASGYEMYAVINASRPLTRTPEDTAEVLREIEAASTLPFTGIVNNTNLGPDTVAETVVASLDYARRTAELMSLPLAFTCCPSRIAGELAGAVSPLFPLDIQKLNYQYAPSAG